MKNFNTERNKQIQTENDLRQLSLFENSKSNKKNATEYDRAEYVIRSHFPYLTHDEYQRILQTPATTRATMQPEEAP